MTYLEKVLFSIDNWDDLRTSMRFEKYLDIKVAMGDCRPVAKGIGMYNMDLEVCYMMDRVDFDKFVRDSDFVANQESFALIPGDVRQPVILEFHNSTREDLELGPMKCYDTTPDSPGWTYMGGEYWGF